LNGEVFAAWKYTLLKKNLKRKNLFYIKMELMKKPMLARPLVIMRNRLIFRAFNKLKAGCKKLRSEEEYE
jgi:hypothetical protein